jgi:phosphoserine aminotransferase
MTKGGKLDRALFEGETINTPSMLCVEDWILALEWARALGGLDALVARADGNSALLHDWADRSPWAKVLAVLPQTRSNTSVCLSLRDPAHAPRGRDIARFLEGEGVALDIASHRDAPPGLRIWCGATIERADIEALLPWLDYAYDKVIAEGN